MLLLSQFQNLIRSGDSFAWFRLPGSNSDVLYISYSQPYKSLVNPTSHKPAFWITPFFSPNLSWCLYPDAIFSNGNLILGTGIRNSSAPLLFNTSQPPSSQKNYLQNVDSALQSIAQNDFQKVVLSAVRSHKVSKIPDFYAYFTQAAELYPNAFVYCLYVPELGIWCGATPERFLSGNKADKSLQTVALAGTAGKIGWTEKEIDEQFIVSTYIENIFRECGIHEIVVGEQRTIVAGELQHLITPISGTYATDNKINTLIYALHPTPAVGGYPRNNALDFILKHELHDRRIYSGFLGPSDGSGNFDFFVNLRCAEFTGDSLLFYSGAGITAGSVAEAEWTETARKAGVSQYLFNINPDSVEYA
jgi:isochorismate synthase